MRPWSGSTVTGSKGVLAPFAPAPALRIPRYSLMVLPTGAWSPYPSLAQRWLRRLGSHPPQTQRHYMGLGTQEGLSNCRFGGDPSPGVDGGTPGNEGKPLSSSST